MADQSQQPTEDVILAALASIPGPDGRTPLPRSGALSEVVVHKGKVYFSIQVDAARASRLEPLRLAAENAVRAVPGVVDVLVSLTEERAATEAPAPGGRRPGPKAQAATTKAGVPGIRHIIAVASGKGGVGKSTTTANLALALARIGNRVGVLDADIYGPSVPKLFDLSNARPETVEGKTLKPLTAHGLALMSIGFLVDQEAAMIWRGPMVMSALQQMLRDVAWGDLDILVIDMPPGTGDAQLTIAQTVPLSGAVIVSTPQDLALIDARRGVTMFEQVAIPVLGIVENMSYFVCPHCGERSDIFGHGGARDEAARRGVPFLGDIPLDMAIRATSDAGQPIVAAEPDGPHAAAYLAIAQQVATGLATPQRPPPRIVIEQ
ncbi:iron-sulfur cluster carrier protein ApbC [Pseudochelatococcus contaminans]|uniref:Iron-sulfur cluster carrier protein n=1 Tax=Pseudochelatococcus contaminans TaxID=1538103 RepID=A0A7W5Z2V7_9HYPH|nr:iron-sulfur cluster carrier protein ApbC [Pseudochelatococcus contaminans]MBB3809008.1 ATP-binding protein involved in chromosome partitioning [Pseudochelatococcus contaminans]